jgi:hypothetical protein
LSLAVRFGDTRLIDNEPPRLTGSAGTTVQGDHRSPACDAWADHPDVDDSISRRSLLALAGLVVAVVVFAVLTMGSQTSKILSTVGQLRPRIRRRAGAPQEEPASAPDDGPAADGQVVTAAAPIPALLIVRTGTLDLEVTDLAQAIAAADDAWRVAGGYVSASTRTVTTDDSTTRATYRIPSAAWDATLGALHGPGPRGQGPKEIRTEEVTGQVVDLHRADLEPPGDGAAFQRSWPRPRRSRTSSMSRRS